MEYWTIGGASTQNRKESSNGGRAIPVPFQTSQIVKTRPPIIRPVELGPAGGPRLPFQRAKPHRKNTGGRRVIPDGGTDPAAMVSPRHEATTDPAQSSRAPVVAALASAGASRPHLGRDATTTYGLRAEAGRGYRAARLLNVAMPSCRTNLTASCIHRAPLAELKKRLQNQI